jgi:hemin uptake protein HemP
MNDLTRSSTLSLRRPAAAALTSRPKASTAAAAPRQPVERNSAAAAGTAAPAVRSENLLQGRSHVNIVHNGETYQLRATRLGKLILTK